MRRLLKGRNACSRSEFEKSRGILLNSKRSFEMPFSWIFAILAGSVIIVISIYAATKLVDINQQSQFSDSANQLSNIMNPIVNGITSAYSTKIELKKETRVYLGCQAPSRSSVFGKQTIATSEIQGFFQKWPEPGANISRNNKYVFADQIMQGKTIYVFSKPFYAGFRVDDLILLSMSRYCFISTPPLIEEEINMTGLKNVNLTSTITSCEKDSVKVCFNFPDNRCNITITPRCDYNGCGDPYEEGTVVKKGRTLFYYGSLIYAAIFSSPDIYECNVKRLARKTNELGKVYLDEIELLRVKSCSTHPVVEQRLRSILELSENVTSSSKFVQVYAQSRMMDLENCKNILCRIYNPEKCWGND